MKKIGWYLVTQDTWGLGEEQNHEGSKMESNFRWSRNSWLRSHYRISSLAGFLNLHPGFICGLSLPVPVEIKLQLWSKLIYIPFLNLDLLHLDNEKNSTQVYLNSNPDYKRDIKSQVYHTILLPLIWPGDLILGLFKELKPEKGW